MRFHVTTVVVEQGLEVEAPAVLEVGIAGDAVVSTSAPPAGPSAAPEAFSRAQGRRPRAAELSTQTSGDPYPAGLAVPQRYEPGHGAAVGGALTAFMVAFAISAILGHRRVRAILAAFTTIARRGRSAPTRGTFVAGERQRA